MPPTTNSAMTRDEMNTKIDQTKTAMEEIWGRSATVNVRPNKRVVHAGPEDHVGEEVLYNTQVEVEVYVPGPGQVAEQAAAEERAKAEAAAREKPEQEAPAQ